MLYECLLSRKFGLDWWSSGEDTSKLFRSIDENNDGAISFNEWLTFALQTYAARSRELAKVPEDMNKEEFLNLCSEAGKKNPEALRSIYFYQLNCFKTADADRDGKVSKEEFQLLLDTFAAAPARLGLKVPSMEKKEAEGLFEKIDENGDGAISFDEWLGFSLTSLISRLQQ